MKVFGLDFTSDPDIGKPLTLAECTLDGDKLRVEALRPLSPSGSNRRERKAAQFAAFEDWLANEKGPWVAGIDVPLGQPVEAIEHFSWLGSAESDQTWENYIQRMLSGASTRTQFKALVESWRHPAKKNAKGEKERLRKYRLCDILAVSHSPMNCIRPPVGQMFFEAVKRLVNAQVSIHPVRVLAGQERHVVEVYPRLVADKWIGRPAHYKDADNTADVRALLVKAIRNEAHQSIRTIYGLAVPMPDPGAGGKKTITDCCLADDKGDLLDSIFCAVQAAWAYKNGYGVPNFTVAALREAVALEGWIADPLMLDMTAR